MFRKCSGWLEAMHKNPIDTSILNNECNVFSYYLIHQRPNHYVLDKYRDAHREGNIFHNLEPNPLDTFLLKIATRYPLVTQLVDLYTSLFLRSSLIRKKMVILLAILESCAPTYAYFDTPDLGRRMVVCIKILQKGVVFILVLFLSIVSLMPLHLLFIISSKFLHRA